MCSAKTDWRLGMRKILTALAILGFIALWIGLIGTVGSLITDQPIWVQLPFYAVAGFAWVLPLKPLLAWMNKPRGQTGP